MALIASLVFTLVGCSSKTTEQKANEEQQETSLEQNEKNNKQDNNESNKLDSEDVEGESEEELKEEPKEEPKEESAEDEINWAARIDDPGYVLNGYWYWKQNFQYNILENKLEKSGTEWAPQLIYDGGEIQPRYNDRTGTSTFMNLTTREALYTLNDNQHWVERLGREGNTALFYEATESFEGNSYSLGIVNEKGEIVMPLTSGFPWDDMISYVQYYYWGDTYYELKCGVDRYILDGTDKSLYNRLPDEFQILAYMDGKFFGTSSWRNFGIYDFITDEYTIIDETRAPHEAKWDGAFWANCGCITDNCFWYKSEGSVYGVDVNNIIQVSYDLSNYAEPLVYYVTKDYICFSCDNGSGVKYLCLMNRYGTMEFSPWKIGTEYPDEADADVFFDDGKLIAYRYNSGEEKGLFIYDVNTQETMTVAEKEYQVKIYDFDTNHFIVKKIIPKYELPKGTEEDYVSCYLVNLEDLHTLINPLE